MNGRRRTLLDYQRILNVSEMNSFVSFSIKNVVIHEITLSLSEFEFFYWDDHDRLGNDSGFQKRKLKVIKSIKVVIL